MSSPRIMVVTPQFFQGGAIDRNATVDMAADRSDLPTIGRLQVPPNDIRNTTLGASWGNLDFNLTEWPPSQNSSLTAQRDYAAGKFSKRLPAVECLTRYMRLTGNQSDALLVSSYDAALQVNTNISSPNSTLLYEYGAQGFDGPGNYWPCGISNTFDCRKPEQWRHDPSIAAEWNVYGYKIDYCLINEVDLQQRCSVRFSPAVMIST